MADDGTAHYARLRLLARIGQNPSAILLLAQLVALLAYPFFEGTHAGAAMFGVFGVAVLLRRTRDVREQIARTAIELLLRHDRVARLDVGRADQLRFAALALEDRAAGVRRQHEGSERALATVDLLPDDVAARRLNAGAAEAAGLHPESRRRFEPIVSPRGWTVIVDYAHTPDALRKTLEALREAFPRASGGRILTVFGCGGNRDRSKRPEMGRIAAGHGDVTIITSDNPRDEDPDAIIDEIAAGIGPGRVESTLRRRGACVHHIVLIEFMYSAHGSNPSW